MQNILNNYLKIKYNYMITNELKNRIADVLNEILIEKFKKNKSKLSEALQSNSTSINNYLKSTTFPQADFIYNLCTELGVNPTWLILGIGDKYLSDKINTVNGNGNTVGYIGNNNSNITQVMHSNDILHSENEALKREVTLLREMVELYKKQGDN